MQLQLHYTSYTTPQLELHYTTTSTAAALHQTTSSSCGWGDHCNHCNHSKKHNSNHPSVHQWIRSAIRDSQQPSSPIGFPSLKLPPPPCAVVTTGIYSYQWYHVHQGARQKPSVPSHEAPIATKGTIVVISADRARILPWPQSFGKFKVHHYLSFHSGAAEGRADVRAAASPDQEWQIYNDLMRFVTSNSAWRLVYRASSMSMAPTFMLRVFLTCPGSANAQYLSGQRGKILRPWCLRPATLNQGTPCNPW